MLGRARQAMWRSVAAFALGPRAVQWRQTCDGQGGGKLWSSLMYSPVRAMPWILQAAAQPAVRRTTSTVVDSLGTLTASGTNEGDAWGAVCRMTLPPGGSVGRIQSRPAGWLAGWLAGSMLMLMLMLHRKRQDARVHQRKPTLRPILISNPSITQRQSSSSSSSSYDTNRKSNEPSHQTWHTDQVPSKRLVSREPSAHHIIITSISPHHTR